MIKLAQLSHILRYTTFLTQPQPLNYMLEQGEFKTGLEDQAAQIKLRGENGEQIQKFFLHGPFFNMSHISKVD